ncbi:MAG: hypothetical protein FVQ83_02445 [Chloroflexi bacterium]|nr:hypothetical protein [Chloroflexota bacterium]
MHLKDNDNIQDQSKNEGVPIVEELLSFRPIPSQQFYKRMERAPWRKVKLTKMHRRRWQAAIAIVLLLILSLTTPILSPSFEAVAERLVKFFNFSETDSTNIQLTNSISAESRIVLRESDFPLTIGQVQNLSPINLSNPTLSSFNLVFFGASYNTETQQAIFYYRGTNLHLLITQQPAGDFFQEVGISATVESVQIEDLYGEFVSGGWVVSPVGSPTPEETQSGNRETVTAIWDPNLLHLTLQWQSEDILYSIMSWGEFTKQDLIGIASSMH